MIQRVRAARGSLNQSLDDFAETLDLGRSTLVRIESGKRKPKHYELERMAAASGLPLGFFTVPDLHLALGTWEDRDPAIAEKVEALERQMRVLLRRAPMSAEDQAALTDMEQIIDHTDGGEDLAGPTQTVDAPAGRQGA